MCLVGNYEYNLNKENIIKFSNSILEIIVNELRYINNINYTLQIIYEK